MGSPSPERQPQQGGRGTFSFEEAVGTPAQAPARPAAPASQAPSTPQTFSFEEALGPAPVAAATPPQAASPAPTVQTTTPAPTTAPAVPREQAIANVARSAPNGDIRLLHPAEREIRIDRELSRMMGLPRGTAATDFLSAQSVADWQRQDNTWVQNAATAAQATVAGFGEGVMAAGKRILGGDLTDEVYERQARAVNLPYDPDTVSGVVGELAGNTMNMLPVMANTPLGLALFGLSAGGDTAIDAAEQRELGREVSIANELAGATGNAAVEMGMELLGTRVWKSLGRAAGPLIRRVGQAVGQRSVPALAQALGAIAGRLGVSGAQGGAEEGLTQIAQNWITQATIDPTRQVGEGVGRATMMGALQPGVMATIDPATYQPIIRGRQMEQAQAARQFARDAGISNADARSLMDFTADERAEFIRQRRAEQQAPPPAPEPAPEPTPSPEPEPSPAPQERAAPQEQAAPTPEPEQHVATFGDQGEAQAFASQKAGRRVVNMLGGAGFAVVEAPAEVQPAEQPNPQPVEQATPAETVEPAQPADAPVEVQPEPPAADPPADPAQPEQAAPEVAPAQPTAAPQTRAAFFDAYTAANPGASYRDVQAAWERSQSATTTEAEPSPAPDAVEPPAPPATAALTSPFSDDRPAPPKSSPTTPTFSRAASPRRHPQRKEPPMACKKKGKDK